MAKLNQIIAVANGQKGRTQAGLTEAYHKLQKGELLNGINRSYRPREEDGEKLPPEQKKVNYRVSDALRDAEAHLTKLFDVVATQDYANCKATADVSVDGKVVLPSVPVTTLLFLEKQLGDLHTLIGKLPTLTTDEEWQFSEEAACYATKPHETVRTKKVLRNHVKAEATKEHPAQVDVYTEDQIVGYWQTIKFSGAIPETRKATLLSRVQKLQDAVKSAREEANGIEVVQQRVGEPVFRFLLAE